MATHHHVVAISRFPVECEREDGKCHWIGWHRHG
jgi:hypothetical protein